MAWLLSGGFPQGGPSPAMPSQNADSNENFTLYASPLMDLYKVLVYPAVPGAGQDFEVSAARFTEFQRLRQSHVEENQLTGSADVLMYSLSEEDVRELTELVSTPGRLGVMPWRAA